VRFGVGGGGVMVTSPQGVVSGVPGLPLVASVSAAVPMVREEGVPGEVVPEPGAEGGRVGQIMRFGFPGLDNIRSHRDYVLSYDRRNRVPHWVFEHLTKESIQKGSGVDRAASHFLEDGSQHTYFRSKNSDYKYRYFTIILIIVNLAIEYITVIITINNHCI